MCEWLKYYIKSLKFFKESCEYEVNMKNSYPNISITSHYTGKVTLMHVTCNETTATLKQEL